MSGLEWTNDLYNVILPDFLEPNGYTPSLLTDTKQVNYLSLFLTDFLFPFLFPSSLTVDKGVLDSRSIKTS